MPVCKVLGITGSLGNRLRLNPVFLLEIILILNTFMIEGRGTKGRTRICRNFKRRVGLESDYLEIIDTENRTCPPTSATFSLYHVTASELSRADSIDLLVCWSENVKRFALHFDNSIQIDDVTRNDVTAPASVLRSCSRTNDTVYYNRKKGRSHSHQLLLTITNTTLPIDITAFYSYTISSSLRSHKSKLRYRINSEDSKRRIKRSTSDEEELSYSSPTQCGKSRNCYRYGEDACGHFGCKYFLSYNRSGSILDIELSAKTSGWVAVGFSSDVNMGGKDEVILCKRTFTSLPNASQVNAATYINEFVHDPPKPLQEAELVSLVSSSVRDGFVFCHVTRPLAGDNHMDLTNAWFQLYAFGKVSNIGELVKHSELPKVSKKVSMMQPMNELTNGSCDPLKEGRTTGLLFVLINVLYFALLK
ncbi:uncharacterized protein LOC128233617 isoform X2 [Mya arenaria]|uniref:uncharacterized protein LOC128233617 isoform X2 n=1 Tax=Mya arenaria TaxID=6604 RepID=UPI0022E244B4|nr:uncharacterized protein LOC128233617 isoform X2 [Mya arenaria]